MRSVIYARYSCDNQREESIEGQLRECKDFVERKGYTLVGSYIDRAVSAKTDNRPEFQRMVKESSGGLFDVVIVWKLDRFARNRYDSAHYKAVLRKNGVKVISATEAISEGAEGIILESVLEGYAEYYSAELSEKVTRGMTENALKCQFNGGGVTIGYTVDENKNYHLDPLVAPFVKDAFEMYAGGKTVKEIVTYLNGKGVRSSHGKPMSKTSVTALLKNVKYKGQYKYRDIIIDDGVPRIVNDELFQLAQERLVKNQYSRSRFKAKVEYFLSTKLFCGECGSLMVGDSGTSRNGRKYNYYK
ncbi:MAG: recombinase family protein, partial [Oscillospiraceae bacterium]|nr:recombinase family protein [Oscillospiraceae bacterium]